MPIKFIPALRFHFLTPFYDWLIKLLLPENKFKQALIDAAKLSGRNKILDIGCGTATLDIMLAYQFPESEIIAVDADDKALQLADKKIKTKNLSNIQLIKTVQSELPFNDSTFDIAFTSLLFSNLLYPEKIKMIKELSRVLKPKSRLIIADWSKPETILNAAGFFVLQCAGGFSNTNDLKKGMLENYLKQNGFNTEVVNRFNTLFGTIRIYNAYLLKVDSYH